MVCRLSGVQKGCSRGTLLDIIDLENAMPMQAAKSSFSPPSTTVNKCASYCNIKKCDFYVMFYVSCDAYATRRQSSFT
jgi:hypothetical protein